MPRKSLSIFLASILSIGFIVPAISAPKEGSKCTSVGKLSGKLTCVSLDGKKFWYEITLAKGVKKYAQVNTDCYRENLITRGFDSNKKRIQLTCKYPTSVQGSEPPKWTAQNTLSTGNQSKIEISIDNLDLIGVPRKAYENVEAVLKSRPRANYTPTFFLSPGLKQARVDQEISGLNRAIDLWQPYFLPDKFQAVYVVLGDEDWLENKSREIGLSSMIPPGETWTMRMKMFSPCGFANAGKANNVPTFVQCLNNDYVGGYKQTGPHEYTHLFQNTYGGQNAFSLPWYTEGSASFFGWTLGFYPNDVQLNERKAWLKTLFQNMPSQYRIDFSSKDITKFKNLMVFLGDTVNNQEIASTSYWVGGLATEVLIALYGFDKYVELTKNMQTSRDVSSLLKQTYGFTADYFYEKLAPYVWAQIPR
jgi:hypothetical protein